MRSLHVSLDLQERFLKAWDYSKVALTWVSAPLRHLCYERCIKGKKKVSAIKYLPMYVAIVSSSSTVFLD